MYGPIRIRKQRLRIRKRFESLKNHNSDMCRYWYPFTVPKYDAEVVSVCVCVIEKVQVFLLLRSESQRGPG